MRERSNAVTFRGTPMTLLGEELAAGAAAPAFTVLDNALAPVGLGDLLGQPLILISVPSLDTQVCDLEARRFNQEAEALAGAVKVAVVSMDLPFAQKRWAEAAEVKHIRTLSDHREASFGSAFGLLIKELRLLARAVYVLDAKGKVAYAELVREISQEPDYAAAMNAAKALR
jgi:thioredoxin-dependent peroxiredoxin